MTRLKRRKSQRSGIRDQDGPIRNKAHLQWVRGHECAIAYKWGERQHRCSGWIEAAHVRTGTDGGAGQKPSDCFSIPLCSAAHAEQHSIGEPAFERRYHISMRQIADDLWARSPHRPRD